jgi:hypothetical protein
MVYLYLGKNTIKVIGLNKTLLGQYNVSHFAKTHSTEFIVNGKAHSVDLIASAIKEAVTSSKPDPLTEKDVCLILPPEVFTFGRYTIPKDMSEPAVLPFIKDKVRNELKLNLDSTYHDYLINTQENDSVVIFYALDQDVFKLYEEALKLLQMRVTKIIPESVAYYTLFEKTLRKDKKENIMYATYNDSKAFAYTYDSFGLLENKKHYLDSANIKTALKELVDDFQKDGAKINRLILSGEQSTSVRQDLFTKEVGAWTNPLEKIIENFYKDYLKTIIPDESQSFSILKYDVCFGAFIFSDLHKEFTLMNQTVGGSSGSRRLPKISIGTGFLSSVFNWKTMGIFAISFLLSFGIIFGFSRLSDGGFTFSFPTAQPTTTPEPTVEPTAVPTPTPSVAREELRVRVLNGTGTAGQAGEVEDALQEAGYAEIVTGNADSFDFETTQVQIKAEFSDALSYIREDLADYVEITEAEELDEDDTADVVITTGADWDAEEE